MSIRVDIDPQDIANVQRDVRKRITLAAVSLAATITLLAAVFAAAGFAAYGALMAMAQNAPGPLPAQVAQLLRAPTPEFITLLVSIAIVVLCAVAAIGVFKARRARGKTKRAERLKAGLTIGRFDYRFTEDHLIIKGRLAMKKIAWSALDRIEDAKFNFIFWKYDGTFEFLPKNAVKEKDLLNVLMKNHGAAIKSNLSFDAAVHAKPLSLSFECSPQDFADYRRYYHRQREGVMSWLRDFAEWRPWPAFLFLVFALLAATSFYAAFQIFDLAAAAIGFSFALAAVSVFFTNASFFRGAAHPFRKDKNWPFAQSEMTSVTLSKNGVFINRNGSTEVIEWQGVQQFLECRLTSYLVIMANDAIALPKRVFLNAEHYRAYASFAKARLSEATRARADHKQQRLMSSLNSRQPGAQPAPAKQQKPAQTQPAKTALKTPAQASAQKAPVQKLAVNPAPAANGRPPAQQPTPKPAQAPAKAPSNPAPATEQAAPAPKAAPAQQAPRRPAPKQAVKNPPKPRPQAANG